MHSQPDWSRPLPQRIVIPLLWPNCFFSPTGINRNFHSYLANLLFGSIGFAINYRWRPRSSNLIVVTRTDAATPDAAAGMNPGSISGEPRSNHEVASDKQSTEAGANTDKRKTAKLEKLIKMRKQALAK